ncbi:hypothetical protein [Myxococcus stipitatus]|uniref:hypothetical protein n=1 Tax=Myxococcus stipitatus TaxID=83455 RepID=UPI0030D06716
MDQARAWTRRTVHEHPVGMGLGALALGFLSASLLPATQAERRVYSRAADRLRTFADELERSGQLDEAMATLRRVAVSTAAEHLVGEDAASAQASASEPSSARPRRWGGRKRG